MTHEVEETLKEIGPVNIDEQNGKFKDFFIDFDSNTYYYGVCNYPCGKYEGTLDKIT